jgi:hypothetical protein
MLARHFRNSINIDTGIDTGGSFGHLFDRLLDRLDGHSGGSFDRFNNRILDPIDFDTGGSFDRFHNRSLVPIDIEGFFGRLCDQLLSRPWVNDAAKLRFERRLLDKLDFLTEGSGRLCDRLMGLNFNRFYNRLLDVINGRHRGSFQQCQQWGSDACNGIDPSLAVTPIALWEQVKLVSDFFECPKSFRLEL